MCALQSLCCVNNFFFFFFFFFFYESLCCKYSKDTQNSRVIANINVFQLH